MVSRFLEELKAMPMMLAIVLLSFYGLQMVSGSPQAMSAVMSESMEPTLYRGDLILAHNRTEKLTIGDIVLFGANEGQTVVHRIIRWSDKTVGRCYLTQGDANTVDDRWLYATGVECLTREQIMGKVVFRIPFVGFPSVWKGEYPVSAVLVMFGLFFQSTLARVAKGFALRPKTTSTS